MKYYIISKIITTMLFIVLLINPTDAALLTSNSYPSSIFKCGGSTISATFSDGGIVSVNAILNSDKPVSPMMPGTGRMMPETQSTNITLSNNGTYWVGTFGNDNTLLWGTRSVSYLINGVTLYPSSTDVFVYSDACIGSNKQNYTQVVSGTGFYTNLLITNSQINSNPVGIVLWAIYPFVQYWGFMFYLLVIFTIVMSVYMKTQSVTQPLFIGIMLLLFASGVSIGMAQLIPNSYAQYVIWIMGIAFAAIYYRTFVKE